MRKGQWGSMLRVRDEGNAEPCAVCILCRYLTLNNWNGVDRLATFVYKYNIPINCPYVMGYNPPT